MLLCSFGWPNPDPTVNSSDCYPRFVTGKLVASMALVTLVDAVAQRFLKATCFDWEANAGLLDEFAYLDAGGTGFAE